MTTLMRWAVSAAFLTCGLALTHAQSPNDWPTVGNDPGGMKFSTLSQITADNVAKLQKAWTYDLGPVARGTRLRHHAARHRQRHVPPEGRQFHRGTQGHDGD